jgi:hypothetical protein
MQLRAAAPDVFDEIRRPWLPSVKNPCYRDSADKVRCLPYLSIIGVSKCGTTDLYKKLMSLRCASKPRGRCNRDAATGGLRQIELSFQSSGSHLSEKRCLQLCIRRICSVISAVESACWCITPPLQLHTLTNIIGNRSKPLRRPFMESRNKGPHFWDESHPVQWYTDIFDPVAQMVERGVATAEGPLVVDASSNTFTTSGVSIRGKRSRKVHLSMRVALFIFAVTGHVLNLKCQHASAIRCVCMNGHSRD